MFYLLCIVHVSQIILAFCKLLSFSRLRKSFPATFRALTIFPAMTGETNQQLRILGSNIMRVVEVSFFCTTCIQLKKNASSFKQIFFKLVKYQTCQRRDDTISTNGIFAIAVILNQKEQYVYCLSIVKHNEVGTKIWSWLGLIIFMYLNDNLQISRKNMICITKNIFQVFGNVTTVPKSRSPTTEKYTFQEKPEDQIATINKGPHNIHWKSRSFQNI